MSTSVQVPPTAPPTGNGPSPAPITTSTLLNNYQAFSGALVNSMTDVAKIADQRISTFLLTLGTLLIMWAMALKIRFPTGTLATLTPGEFIALLLVATMLIVAGSAIRLQQLRKEQENFEWLRESNYKLLGEANQLAIRAAEERAEAWKLAQERLQQNAEPGKPAPQPPEW